MVIQGFRNRRSELEELKDVLNSKKPEIVVMYGRRRIGKTELILRATENTKRMYYLSVGEKNLERFHASCVVHYPEASKLKADWEVLFEFLASKADVVIIDEFQNLLKENQNVLHIFQVIADVTMKGSTLKLFLLGSSVSIMTSEVLSYKSPLYGRRTASMELKAIPFFSMREFFPRLGIKDVIEIYGFADGIPHYLSKIDGDFWQWLKAELGSRKGFLRDEVDFLMKYEFTDSSTYKLILEAIANGKTKLNEIKDFVGLKRTDISPYLSNLLEVKMIKRDVPVTENVKSRISRYTLSDNFLKFWFRFIYPNLSSIEEGIFDVESVREDYPSYLGFIFEEVARQFLIQQKEFAFSRIGKWWHKDKEIDLITLNEKSKEILFCECKWRDNVDSDKLLEELKEKAKYVEWNIGRRQEHYLLFAKSFKGKKDYCFDLQDIEHAMRGR